MNFLTIYNIVEKSARQIAIYSLQAIVACPALFSKIVYLEIKKMMV